MLCERRVLGMSEADRRMVDKLHSLFKQGRFVELFTEAKEWGAAAERARIRVAVLNLGGLIMGESDYILLKHVLFILKDGDAD